MMSRVSNILVEFAKHGITYKVSDQLNGWRVFLFGGNEEIRRKFQRNLQSKEGLKIQALLVLERAKENPDLMYEIEERNAIRRWDGGIEESLLDSILTKYRADLTQK